MPTPYPSLFTPRYRNDTPEDVFRPRWTPARDHCRRCQRNSNQFPRLVSIDDPHSILVYVDGSCLNNGRDNPRAGAAFVDTHKYDHQQDCELLGGKGFRVEHYGPTGEYFKPTSNRAELRAVLAALNASSWELENVRTLVLATDSTYVVNGCADQAFHWEHNDWYNHRGERVRNRDLWSAIVDAMLRLMHYRVEVQIWKIPREWNSFADELAYKAATGGNQRRDYFTVY